MLSTTAALLPSPALLLIVPLLAYVLYQCYLSPLAKVPGPFVAKLTQLYLAYITRRGRLHRDYVDIHEKYGPVVRVGPNLV
jgi:hypothetical protein